jgi:hypothetical protein
MDQQAKASMAAKLTGTGPDIALRILRLVDAFLAQVTPNAPLGSQHWAFLLRDKIMDDLPGSAVALRIMGECCQRDPAAGVLLLKKARFVGVAAEVADAARRGNREEIDAKQAELDALLYESFDELPDPVQRLRAYLDYEGDLHRARTEYAALKRQ